MNLPQLRQRIDRLDERLLALVSDRALLAIKIGQLKRRKKWPLYDARREAFVLQHVGRMNQGPLSDRAVQQIFQSILTQCRRRERTGKPRKSR